MGGPSAGVSPMDSPISIATFENQSQQNGISLTEKNTVNPSIEPPGALYFNLPKKVGSISGRGSNRGGGAQLKDLRYINIILIYRIINLMTIIGNILKFYCSS
jgi:hypothetical protein